MADDTHSRFAMVVVVGHMAKHMTHSHSWDMEIGRPSVENVTLGLRPRVTFSTSGSSYFHVPLTTVSRLLTVGRAPLWLLLSAGWLPLLIDLLSARRSAANLLQWRAVGK